MRVSQARDQLLVDHGISVVVSTWWHWENGVSEPSATLLPSVAAVVGVAPMDLLTEAEGA